MKKLFLTLFLIFSSFIIDGGSANSNAEENEMSITKVEIEAKIANIEKEIYKKSLIQYIEFDAEIIIPDYFDFKYVEYLYNVGNELGLSTRSVFRLVYRESTFRDTVVSPVGAKGLMQLMPETRNLYYGILRLDTLNLDKNQEDILIGLNLLKDLNDFWIERGNSKKYSWKLALASYNAGKGNVIKYKGIPPFKETVDFVDFINRTHSNPAFLANYSKKYGDEIKPRT